jgi:hypothetical protein
MHHHDLSVVDDNAETMNMESTGIFGKFGVTNKNSKSSGIGNMPHPGGM